MPKTLESWMEEGMHLPAFMRDFHDQKDLFKMMDAIQRRPSAGSGYAPSADLPSFGVAQVYTVDVFLWVMARHGYTLQRARSPFGFVSLAEKLSAFRRRLGGMPLPGTPAGKAVQAGKPS